MNPSRRPQGAPVSLRTSASTVGDPPPATYYQLRQERTETSHEPRGAAIITYRGIRGLKHKDDHLRQPVTTTVSERPPGQAVNERLTSWQNGVDHCPSSSDQRRPVQSSSSCRRSVSADRHTASTSTPRTLFETLYHDKVQ